MKNFLQVNRALAAKKNFQLVNRALAAEKNFRLVNRALAAKKNFRLVNRALAAENNFYLNLNQLPSKNDGEPTVNRQSRVMSQLGKRSEKEQLSPTCLRSASVPLSFRSRYLRYAAVIFCVLVMSVGQAWADNVTISADEMVAGDTKSHITPDAGAEAVVSEQQVWLDGSTKKKYNCLQLSSASGTSEVLGALKTKSVFFTVDDGYKITGFTVSGASNKDASTTAPIVMACWTGDVSRTPALIAQITLPDRQTSSLPSIVASSIPAGTKTIALYRRVKVDNTTTPTELVSSSGYDYGSGNTGNIVSVTITYEAAASTKRIYMKAGAWNGSSPKFYVHSWLDSDNNTEEMALADCETDVYYADIPSTHTGLLFTRQDPSSTGLDWTYSDNSGKLWNQSEDIIIGSNDKFTFSSWGTGDGHPKSSFSGGTYSAPTYTISYAAGTGSGTMSSQTGIACGTDKATTSNTFTAPSGYNFTGWKANVGVKVGGSTKTAGTLLDDGVTIQDISSNITLTAQWEEEVTYSVTYNANGATGSVPTDASSPYSTGATVTVLGKNTLAKTDNGFAGWRTATSSGTWYVPGETFAMGSANVNLYAQWVAEASLVSGTLYQAANLKSAALTSTSAESDRYRAGISSNGVSEILGTGIANATAGPMEYNTISSTTVGDASFTSVLYFKGTGSGSPSATGTTIPTSRSIKFRVPSKGTLHLYVKGPGSISLIKSGGTAAVIGSGDANAYVTTDVTAGTYYLFATASSRSLYGLKFVEESCSATQPGTIGKGTLSGCTLRLTAAGSPASNNTWYWQSSEDGIDKSESGATKDVTSTGTYYIRSYCTTGSGCWSDARSVTVSASDLTPAAPTNFTAGSISATGATFTIADAGNASSYDIYYSTSSTAPTSDVTITSTSKSKAVTGLTFNTTYYAWVRAVCGSNKSDWVALSGSTFTTSNAAPTSASISPLNGWIYVPGETITLTASAETTNASTTYTWYRGATIEAAKAAGVIQAARTAAAGGTTYTIASCKAADAYKYWVEISNGTGYETSTSYDIKIYTFFLYDNTPSEIGDYTFSTIDRVNNKISVTIPLSNINYTYQFKVSDGLGTWYGCNDATITGSHAYWDGLNSTGDNVGLTSSFADDYKIDYYYNSNNVVVTYPVHNQAEDVKVYFDNRLTEMENMYIRIGHDANSKASSAFTLVPGTANLYVGTTTSFNDFHAWSIADNTGWTGSNTIYQPWNDGGVNKPDNEYAITKQTNYQRYVVDETISIIPTSENNTEYGCTYWNVDKVSGMKTDRVTISDYSNGTITVNYVDTEEEEASFTSGYADLAHTVKLTSITAVPNTGYDAGAITINDDAYETNYVVTANTTIAASFTPHVYSITYLDKGGSAFSGSHADGYPTTHTYATATTLKTASKTGYTFDGWYGNSACTGAPMTSIGATSITADITLYAKWTAAASLTALECNTLYKVPDMIPSGASLTSSDQFFDGLSTNTKFELIGSGSDETTPKVNNSSSNDKTIDGITFDDGSMWFKGTASLTSNIPTTFGLSFIVPEGGGKLYLYFSGTSTNIKLAKSGEAGSKPSCPNGYGAVDVTAGTYYLYGTGTSAPYCFYGLKLCSTYSVSITTNNTTKTSGETGSTAAVNGKAYTAIFTANTGYTLPSDVTVSIGGTPATKGTEYTWSVSDGTGTLTVPAAYVTGDIVITVTGVDDGTSFDITYNYNGGTGSPASDRGSSVDLPNPTRSGYVLQGWYTTDGTKLGDGGEEGVALTEDVEVYAKWYATCEAGGGTITWDFSNRTASDFTSGSSYSFTATDGETEMRYTAGSTEGIVAKTDKKTGYLKENGNTGGGSYKDVDGTTAIGKNRLIRLFVGNGSGTLRINCTNDHSGTWKVLDGSASGTILISSLAMNTTSSKITVANSLLWIETTAKGYITSIVWTPSGGGGGTCRHVTYDGNGAESGFVNDTTSYASGDEVTVLGNGGRYPYVKSGYEIAGWADTKDKADAGTIDYAPGATFDITADKTLYAVWRVENIALVTYTLNVGSSAGTTLKSSVDSGDDTNVPESNIDIDTSKSGISGSGAAGGGSTTSEARSAAMSIKTGANGADWSGEPTNYVVFKYKVACGKKLIPSKVSMKVSNKGSSSKNNIKYKAVMSDGYGHTLTGTYVVGSQDGTVEEFAITNSDPDVYFQGNVTLKLWAWTIATKDNGGDGFRMGTPVQIFGVIDDQATPTATITWTKQPAGGLSGTNETVTAVSSDGSAVTITSNNGSVATVAGSTVSYVGVGSTYLIASGTDACGNTMVSVNSDNFTVIGAYNLTYNKNGGGVGTMDADEIGVHYAVVAENEFTAPDGKTFYGWNTAANGSGDSYQPGDAIELNANTTLYAQWGTALTATWSVTKVDSKLYRGGGGYSVTVYLDDKDWNASGDKDDLDLTATEGVTLKNIVKSINGSGKAQVTANFDITTGVDADATSITFTLFVPAAGTYSSAELPHNEGLTSCAATDGEVYYSYTISSTSAVTDATTTGGTFTSYNNGGTLGSASGFYTLGDNGISKAYFIINTTDEIAVGDKIAVTTNNTEFDLYTSAGVEVADNVTTYYTVVADDGIAGTHSFKIGRHDGGSQFKTFTVTSAGSSGGITPTLSWETDLSTTVEKETGDADFTFTATQDKNSLGAITYSSNNTAVATVNATTGKVHIVGAAGEATITATLAASGCFEEATATYTINVVDNCIDEPGTITSRDLGCDGTELTVSGHTELTGVRYQWYKVGSPDEAISGATSATYTATAAGEYYVIVTNSGTGHCPMASTNTVTVTAKAAATATKIVDSWYVKNGRRTPDVALVQSENAESFTVKSGSTTIWESAGSTKTGFGGCGFHMDENGIIYLNGTTAEDGSGNAPSGLTGDADVILKITAEGCGGNASELSITIHCQASTTRKSIAFVVDGTEKGTFAQANADHSTNSALYQFLDYGDDSNGAFDLTAQNIYSTTDEKAIREHFSQFDAIIITDDPSTKKNPANKSGDYYKNHGYVNAFGTMIDVRPILSMEAFVSRLTNWGAKGVAGDPSSPNPRQYEMRLECKDHEIYSGLPAPAAGTHVWAEFIDGYEYRHVIMVDSTKSPYNGVAYNADTDDKPALQGFESEDMGNLLGLGLISDGNLHTGIERQEEPAARMMILGVQAKALPNALTEEGKKVIENALEYLLKTNMEDVNDCSNYFTAAEDDQWNNLANWTGDALPDFETRVRILKPVVVPDGCKAVVARVDIATSGASKHVKGECNGSVTVAPQGALIVGGKIRSARAPQFGIGDLMPMDDPSKLIINTGSTAQAALIFDNDDADTKATVNLYSLGCRPSSYQYQYFAVPMEVVPVNPAFANETHDGTGIYTYVYSEATSGWTRRKYYDDLFAFEGLGITTKSTGAMNYTMTGNLASTATKEITLTHDGAGLNLVGNSWMAPIQIGALAEDNTDTNITKTVYIYCAGRDAEGGAVVSSDDTETAGQWLAVPFEAAEFATWKATGKLSVIPAMQAFEINVSAEATLTLDYDKVVRGSTNDLNAKLRAPGRRMAANEVTMTNIRVADSKTHTDLSLFEGNRFSEAFDNGWEAEYMNCDGRSAKLYAETEAGQMAVAAMYDYEGTVVGFAPGQETEYTFSFMGEDNGYYLNDIKLQNSVRISEGETYTFTYEEGDTENRFYISRTAINAPEVATGMENLDAAAPKVQKIIYNDKLYIIRGGRLYDATGKVVK